MSKGMQQRLGIAQAMIGAPPLLLLDEPTSALDPAGRRVVRDLLEELRHRGTSVLLNSHLLSEVELVCDHVVIVDHGRVVAAGTPDELRRQGGVDGPFCVVDRDRRLSKSCAGRVHKDVDMPEFFDYALVKSPDRITIANIRGYEESPAAKFLDLGADFGQQFRASSCWNNIRSVPRQTERDLLPEARCRAKHHRDAAGQIEAISSHVVLNASSKM